MFLLKAQYNSVDLANISSRRWKLKLKECKPGYLTGDSWKFKAFNVMRCPSSASIPSWQPLGFMIKLNDLHGDSGLQHLYEVIIFPSACLPPTNTNSKPWWELRFWLTAGADRNGVGHLKYSAVQWELCVWASKECGGRQGLTSCKFHMQNPQKN